MGYSLTLHKNQFHMILKWLIVSLIVYFIYRNFIASPKIDKSGGQDQQQIRNEKDGTAEDGEYIDFEEID